MSLPQGGQAISKDVRSVYLPFLHPTCWPYRQLFFSFFYPCRTNLDPRQDLDRRTVETTTDLATVDIQSHASHAIADMARLPAAAVMTTIDARAALAGLAITMRVATVTHPPAAAVTTTCPWNLSPLALLPALAIAFTSATYVCLPCFGQSSIIHPAYRLFFFMVANNLSFFVIFDIVAIYDDESGFERLV